MVILFSVIYVEDIESGSTVAMPMLRGGSFSEALGTSPPRVNGPGNMSKTSSGKLNNVYC